MSSATSPARMDSMAVWPLKVVIITTRSAALASTRANFADARVPLVTRAALVNASYRFTRERVKDMEVPP